MRVELFLILREVLFEELISLAVLQLDGLLGLLADEVMMTGHPPVVVFFPLLGFLQHFAHQFIAVHSNW